MNMKRAFINSWKFVKEEKLEIITISITTITFLIIGELLPKYAPNYQYLASYMPNLVIVAPLALFLFRFAILYKKTGLMRYCEIVRPLKDRHYNSRLVITAFNASTFIIADIILIYAFAIGFFAFAFNAGTEIFPEVWHNIHMAEVAFPLLSLFTLVCMRRK